MNDLQPKKKKSRKWLGRFLGIVLIVLAVFAYVRYYYVFGTGVKSGELNYLVYKGVIFKTYEGKLIQTGFRADKPGGLQSNQFDFSVEDKEIAEKLMLSSGKHVQLHYKEFFAPIPWRGYTKFIVDSIISIEEPRPDLQQEIVPYVLDTM
ncbi:MAG TPA: hypothetical protein GXX42_11405 [Petrimonas sp.]|uniref:hypothetical protein n=1 Tax=Petrimonas sp. TaxID=2023866 RepID=UPI0009691116|nr:hypothetical protein [Petrimonas sp.]OJV38474.1 MAG: hypothetical protein BGO33_06670 [Bacteroidia bacterium 43-41]MEA4979557.1 hypothetical protein [Petrimonas sp.]MEA5043485.1 hypothetical protein [Petrimonas sp.]MEA5063460.1 hypothetical protein [Petrimonas sp.]